jgi:hypothetical protein
MEREKILAWSAGELSVMERKKILAWSAGEPSVTGREKILTWSVKDLSALEWDDTDVYSVVMSGRIDVLQWLLQEKRVVQGRKLGGAIVHTGVWYILASIKAVCLAVSQGFLHMVRWLEENSKELVRQAIDNNTNYIQLLNAATVSGHIYVLEHLYAYKGYSLPEHVREGVQWCLPAAASKGYLVVLEWWRQRRISVDYTRKLHTLRGAVVGLQWPVVRWLETHILDRDNLAREYVFAFRFEYLYGASFAVHDWVAARTSLSDWMAHSYDWGWRHDVQDRRQKSLLTLVLCNRRRGARRLPAEVWEHLVAPLLDLPA